MKKKNNRSIKLKRKLATAGYILPFAAVCLLTVLFSLKSFYFTDYAGDVKQSSSIFERIADNFKTGKIVLLSENNLYDAAYTSFYSLLMTAIAIILVLFVIALTVTFLYMLVGLLYLHNSENSPKLRRLFITFIPNKAVVCILGVLSLAPAFFPYILTKLIDRVLMVYTKVNYLAGDIIIWGTLIWCLVSIYYILTKKYDSQDINIFARQKAKLNASEDCAQADRVENDPAREEQIENLRKLLRLDEEEK